MAYGILPKTTPVLHFLAYKGTMVVPLILGSQFLAVGAAIRAPCRQDIAGSSSPGGAGEGLVFLVWPLLAWPRAVGWLPTTQPQVPYAVDLSGCLTPSDVCASIVYMQVPH